MDMGYSKQYQGEIQIATYFETPAGWAIKHIPHQHLIGHRENEYDYTKTRQQIPKATEPVHDPD